MNHLIYLLDADKKTRGLFENYLKNEGYRVKCFAGTQMLFSALSGENEKPALFALDLSSCGSPGLNICGRIREESSAPLILLSESCSSMERVAALSLGADDLLLKAPVPLELSAKIKALLRRVELSRKEAVSALAGSGANASEADVPQEGCLSRLCDLLCYGDLTLNASERSALCRDEPLALTPNEFDFLAYMFRKKGAVKKAELLEAVWHNDASSLETRVTDDLLKRLRKKLKEAESSVCIESVWGFGYRLCHCSS